MSEALPPRVVAVLGIHRSGIGVVSRGLAALGVRFPAGDDADLAALNDEILAATGRYWHTLPPVAAAELDDPALLPLIARAEDLLRQRLAGGGLIGLGDPRLTRLFPLWQRVFERLGVPVQIVIVSRQPASVAGAIGRHDRFPPHPVYSLWLDYLLSALRHTAGLPRVVVDVGRLRDDPAQALGRIAARFGWPIEEAAVAAYRETVRAADPDTSHPPEEEVPQAAADLYRLLTALAADDLSDTDPAVAGTQAAVAAQAAVSPDAIPLGPAFFDLLDPATQAAAPASFPASGAVDALMPVDVGQPSLVGVSGWARDNRTASPTAGILAVGTRRRYLSVVPSRRPDVDDHRDAEIGFFSVIPQALIGPGSGGLRLYAVTADGKATPLNWFCGNPVVPPLRVQGAVGSEQLVTPLGRVFQRHAEGEHPLPVFTAARDGGDMRGLWFDYPGEEGCPAALAIFAGDSCVAYTEIVAPLGVLILVPSIAIEGQRLRIATLWADGQFGLSRLLPLDILARMVAIRHRL